MSIVTHAAAPVSERSISSLPSLEKSAYPPVNQRRRLAGLLIVLTVAFLPWVMTSVLVMYGMDTGLSDSSIRYRYFNGLMMELTSLALLFYVITLNGQSLAEFGLIFRPTDIVHGVLLWAGTLCCYRLAYPTILPVCELLGWHRTAPYLPFLKLGPGLLTYCFLFLNPVFEEMIVRAFLISEAIALTGSSALAILLSFLLQTSYHLYQGLPYALAAGVIFLFFSVYYARTRRIVPVILAHFIFDFSAHLSYALIQARPGHS